MLCIPSSKTYNNDQTDDEKLEKYKSEQMTLLWWSILVRIAIFNICVWTWTCYTYHSSSSFSTSNTLVARQQLYLSGIYVFVCAYRSIYPRIDLERYCMFDAGWITSVFMGRFFATIAEISYASQFALFLYHLSLSSTTHTNTHTHNQIHILIIQVIAYYMIVPLITIAQGCCWCGVVSLKHKWHAIEESIWAFVSALVCFCFGSLFLSLSLQQQQQQQVNENNEDENEALSYSIICVFGVIFSAGYFAFMVLVDVPMYWQRSISTSNNNDDVWDGLYDAWSRRVITKDWNKVWKEEAPWLTGYFSFAVWSSIAMVHYHLH